MCAKIKNRHVKPIPLDHPQIKVVSSIAELMRTEFNEQANVILCRRELKGDHAGLTKTA